MGQSQKNIFKKLSSCSCTFVWCSAFLLCNFFICKSFRFRESCFVSDAGGAVAVDLVDAQHRRAGVSDDLAILQQLLPSDVAVDSARLDAQQDTIPRRRSSSL